MYPDTVQQFSTRQRGIAVNAAFDWTTDVLAGIEKLIELNMQTIKTSLSEQQVLVDAALSARTLSEVIDLQSRQFPAGVKKTFAYLRHVEEIGAYMGSGVFSALHEQTGSALRAFTTVMDFASFGATRQEPSDTPDLLVGEQPATVHADEPVILDSSGKVVSLGHTTGKVH
jgi:phasin family protein